MATYSQPPVFIDGVRLDSSAFNVEGKVREIPGVRNADAYLPGVDGVAQSVNDDFEAGGYTLSMFVLGCDSNGVVPSGSSAVQMVKQNLDDLSFIFGKRHALINVVEQDVLGGTSRQFWGKVIDRVRPEIKIGAIARYEVAFSIGDAVWADETTPDFSLATVVSGTTYNVSTLAGSTGPINDAIFALQGPAVNPQINDIATGAYVRLNGSIAAGASWRVNSGTWATRTAAGGLSVGSADTAGSSADGITVNGGGSARLLRLVPMMASGQRRVQVSVTGTGFASTTGLAVRARRKFLL